jgi:hypothetical protein
MISVRIETCNQSRSFLALVLCFLGIALSSGCVAPKNHAPVQMYEGPQRPLNQVALLFPSNGALIQSIDGTPTPVNALNCEISPGKHQLKASYKWVSSDYYSRTTATGPALDIPVTVEAGHIYLLYAQDGSHNLTRQRVWRAWLLDLTDKASLGPDRKIIPAKTQAEYDRWIESVPWGAEVGSPWSWGR